MQNSGTRRAKGPNGSAPTPERIALPFGSGLEISENGDFTIDRLILARAANIFDASNDGAKSNNGLFVYDEVRSGWTIDAAAVTDAGLPDLPNFVLVNAPVDLVNIFEGLITSGPTAALSFNAFVRGNGVRQTENFDPQTGEPVEVFPLPDYDNVGRKVTIVYARNGDGELLDKDGNVVTDLSKARILRTEHADKGVEVISQRDSNDKITSVTVKAANSPVGFDFEDAGSVLGSVLGNRIVSNPVAKVVTSAALCKIEDMHAHALHSL